MGSKISIDKHVSNIEDILAMNPVHFSKLKIENNIPNTLTQHIKIWRYYEDDKRARALKSAPINLKDILSTDFNFVPNECYLVLFVYKKSSEEAQSAVNFPASLLGVLESSSNLTPRGLDIPVASSESVSSRNRGILESFLLPKKSDKNEEGKFEYMLFVWNGKTANPLMKAITLSAAVEFDALINKAKDPFLHVLFSGGYVRNKKLWMGKILQLDSVVPKEVAQDMSRKFEPLKDSIYLLKYLFPTNEPRQLTGFKDRFIKPKAQQKAEEEFVVMGEVIDDPEDEEYIEGASLIDYAESSEKRESEFEEEIPQVSSRKENGFQIPKLPFGTSAASAREHDSKAKKMIPNLGLGGFGNLGSVPQRTIDLGFGGAQSSHSQERSEDEPPMSSGRTSDSQNSRSLSDRRIPQREQPLMNLALGNIAQSKPLVNTFEDLQRQFGGDKIYDAKESDIKRVKKDFFSEQCNAVIEGFLFVAGETIAYNEKKLEENGVTHILNAAGDACENKFPEKIKYLTFYLKDSRSENIECVFYDAIAFIESARQQNGRVLVHCVQGVSRSVALCISYLILKHEFTFEKAYNHIRSVREIASPNPAFWAQLYNFQLRLYGPAESLQYPRVFCVGSFQRETPQKLVARMLFETSTLFNPKSPKTLDPRAVFILQAKDRLYLWIGSEILLANKDRYIEKAEQHIQLLQQYENASEEYHVVHCGEEPTDFWNLWETEPQNKYGRNKEWDLWFVDLASHKNVEGTTIYEEQEEDEDEAVSAPVYVRPALYCFPELEPLSSVDMDELVDKNLLVLCTQEDGVKVAYLWKGHNVAPEVEDQSYLANVLKQRWPETDPSNIRIENEIPDDESDTFINYFQ